MEKDLDKVGGGCCAQYSSGTAKSTVPLFNSGRCKWSSRIRLASKLQKYSEETDGKGHQKPSLRK
jgi:hypothetical protein